MTEILDWNKCLLSAAAIAAGFLVYKFMQFKATHDYYEKTLSAFPFNTQLPWSSWPWLFKRHLKPDDRVKFIDQIITGTKADIGISRFIPLPNKHYLLITGLEQAEAIWKSNKTTAKGAPEPEIWSSIFGKCLLSMNGPDWATRRKMLNKSFHSEMLMVSYVPAINQCCGEMVRFLKMENGKQVKLRRFVSAVTLDIAFTALFGQQLDIQKANHENGVPTFFELLFTGQIMPTMSKRILNPLYWMNWSWRLLDPNGYKDWKAADTKMRLFLSEIIAARRALKSSTVDSGRLYVIDYMIDEMNRGAISPADVVSEMLLFFAGGSDTSASALGDGLAFIAADKRVQGKLRDEIHRFFDKSEDVFVDSERLAKMKYLDLVAKEILRLCAPVVFHTRLLTSPVEFANGLVVNATESKPVDTMIILHAINRSEKLWGEDAGEFRPERHEEQPEMSKRAFCTFSRGPRNCIGRSLALTSIKIELVHLFNSFELSCDENLYNRRMQAEIMYRFRTEPIIKVSCI